MNLVWAVVMAAAAVGLLVAAARIDPHHSNADGTRFTCRVQVVDLAGRGGGRWRKGRAFVTDDRVSVAITGGVEVIGGLEVHGRGAPGRGRAVFVLGRGQTAVALSVPARSPAAATLDRIAG